VCLLINQMNRVSPVMRSLDALSCVGNVLTLPRGPVEPTFIALQQSQNQDSWGDDSRISCTLGTQGPLGPLFAPCGVRADNIFVRGLAKFVQLGRPLQFELALSNYPSHTQTELNIAAASVAFHTNVSVSLVSLVSQVHWTDGTDGTDGAKLLQPLPLQATLTPASAGSGNVNVIVTIDVPKGTPRDAEVVIDSVTFAGQAVSRCLTGFDSGAEVQTLPLYMPVRLRVMTGMHAPLRLKRASYVASTVAITPDGTLYAPERGSLDVLVFAPDGTPLPSLHLKTMRLCHNTCSAAFVYDFVEDKGTLLLADARGTASQLVAVDTASMTVRWSAALENSCYGIAVLPAQGVVITSNFRGTDHLSIHHLSSGTRVAGVSASNPLFLAADPSTATVYASTSGHVTAFCWDGAALVCDGVVEAAGAFGDARPLAVVPPAPGPESGQRTSYLVVGTECSTTLRVLSLPDRRLVHRHKLEGMYVVSLAADPSGTALAVCDAATRAIHVLPWPLPGLM